MKTLSAIINQPVFPDFYIFSQSFVPSFCDPLSVLLFSPTITRLNQTCIVHVCRYLLHLFSRRFYPKWPTVEEYVVKLCLNWFRKRKKLRCYRFQSDLLKWRASAVFHTIFASYTYNCVSRCTSGILLKSWNSHDFIFMQSILEYADHSGV